MTQIVSDVAKTVAVQRRPGSEPEIHFAVEGMASTISLPNVIKKHVANAIARIPAPKDDAAAAIVISLTEAISDAVKIVQRDLDEESAEEKRTRDEQLA